MAIGSTQPLTETSTRNISWGVKAAGVWGWQHWLFHVPSFLNSGSLNLLEPSRPVQTCSGISLPLLFSYSLRLHESWCCRDIVKARITLHVYSVPAILGAKHVKWSYHISCQVWCKLLVCLNFRSWQRIGAVNLKRDAFLNFSTRLECTPGRRDDVACWWRVHAAYHIAGQLTQCDMPAYCKTRLDSEFTKV